MSLLAVSVQFYGKPKIWSYVPAGAFFPPPKVDSAILLIETYLPEERPCPGVDEPRFFEIVRAGFSQKRKQIANSLASGLAGQVDKTQVQAALADAGIESTRRAESLTLQEWARLYASLGAV
jgi:16S rRNA (adenine1518-N6/adenine1519-N6)-dimethyltransferase